MLIAVCSLKGSPGATTWSLALAAHWPQPARTAVVECDPSGGSLLARYQLPPSPGLTTLASATYRDPVVPPLWSHAQRLPTGLSAVVAPPGADHTRATLNALLGRRTQALSVLRSAATPPDTVVIADCGRLDHASPAVRIAREADRVLLLVRPRGDELAHLAAALTMVDLWSMRPTLLLVGPGYSETEVARQFGTTVAARLPIDPYGAHALYSPELSRRRTESALCQAARDLARSMTAPGRGHHTPRPKAIEYIGHIP